MRSLVANRCRSTKVAPGLGEGQASDFVLWTKSRGPPSAQRMARAPARPRRVTLTPSPAGALLDRTGGIHAARGDPHGAHEARAERFRDVRLAVQRRRSLLGPTPDLRHAAVHRPGPGRVLRPRRGRAVHGVPGGGSGGPHLGAPQPTPRRAARDRNGLRGLLRMRGECRNRGIALQRCRRLAAHPRPQFRAGPPELRDLRRDRRARRRIRHPAVPAHAAQSPLLRTPLRRRTAGARPWTGTRSGAGTG